MSVDPKTLTLVDAPQELQGPIREFWPEEEWDHAAQVAYCESGWRFDAEIDSRTPQHPCGSLLGMRNGVKVYAEHSIGYFQINVCGWPSSWDERRLFNARENAGTAHALWDRDGWNPWYFSARLLGLS